MRSRRILGTFLIMGKEKNEGSRRQYVQGNEMSEDRIHHESDKIKKEYVLTIYNFNCK
jgi:hypothetical protein